MANKKPKQMKIYQLKISLDYIKPSIWRRIQVRNNITLEELHMYLNEAMGWYNSHLHEFIINGQYYGMFDPENNLDYQIIDEAKIKINKVLKYEKQKFGYEYDFGDGWKHTVVLEKILDGEKNTDYPICIAGKRACPPENCGSYPGYERICELMQNPETATIEDNEYSEMIEWLGASMIKP